MQKTALTSTVPRGAAKLVRIRSYLLASEMFNASNVASNQPSPLWCTSPRLSATPARADNDGHQPTPVHRRDSPPTFGRKGTRGWAPKTARHFGLPGRNNGRNSIGPLGSRPAIALRTTCKYSMTHCSSGPPLHRKSWVRSIGTPKWECNKRKARPSAASSALGTAAHPRRRGFADATSAHRAWPDCQHFVKSCTSGRAVRSEVADRYHSMNRCRLA